MSALTYFRVKIWITTPRRDECSSDTQIKIFLCVLRVLRGSVLFELVPGAGGARDELGREDLLGIDGVE